VGWRWTRIAIGGNQSRQKHLPIQRVAVWINDATYPSLGWRKCFCAFQNDSISDRNAIHSAINQQLSCVSFQSDDFCDKPACISLHDGQITHTDADTCTPKFHSASSYLRHSSNMPCCRKRRNSSAHSINNTFGHFFPNSINHNIFLRNHP
jgi:hypothetical protein